MIRDPALLLAALEPAGSLRDRLQAFATAVATVSGSTGVGLIVRLGDAGVQIAVVAGSLEPDRALELAPQGIALADYGWLVCEGPDDPSVPTFAARLLARDLALTLAAQRKTASDLGVAFVSHQMGNRLMPLLCNEAVSNDAKQLRGLIDLLRHLRGRIMLRDLVGLPAFLGTLQTFLRHRRSGEFFDLQVASSEEAQARCVGPEQSGLLPELLHIGYVLRDLIAPSTQVELFGSIADDGVLELGYRLQLERGADALALADITCPPGSDRILELDGAALRVGFRLRDRPSVVVLDVAPPPDLLTRLAAAGLDIRKASGPDQALEAAIRPPQPWVILIANDAWPTARPLKRQLAIKIPALAMRCYRLDEANRPVGYEVEAPDHVDLRALLGNS